MGFMDHADDLSMLHSEDLIANYYYFRGFVEKVSIRANRLLELADELYALAPIRHLSLVGVPASLDDLAASPHLARIRSLSLPELHPDDAFTDESLIRFLSSPHLRNLVHLRLGGHPALTAVAHQFLVTAPTLPRLSNIELYSGQITCWAEPITINNSSSRLTYFEQVIQGFPKTADLRDTPIPVALRPEDWIVELERKLGYQPILHPELHYGRYYVDIEAVTASPIADDPAVMALRGRPVPDPGPKPSLMERRRQGVCAICGCPDLTYLPPPGDLDAPSPNPYDNPYLPPAGFDVCDRCGTQWRADAWPERER
jgi:hypothetical protein